MKAKRPPLALKPDAFAAHAIAQPDPVQIATAPQPASPRTAAPRSAPVATARRTRREPDSSPHKSSAKTGQPSRAGKVQVVAWIAEERRTELKIVAAKLRRTVDDLLTSMIDDLIKTHLDS
jgi:hypothetical protein